MVAARRARPVGADVQHLVAHDRPDLEPLVVDRQQHDGGLELAAADAVGGLRGVAADEPHGHLRVSLRGTSRRASRGARRRAAR